MRIRTKLAVALVIVTLVLGSGVYVGLELFKDQATERMRNDVDETANRTADQIDAVFRERENTVRFYASQPRAANFSRTGPYLRQVVDSTRFYAARMIARNGTVIDYRGQITEAGRQQVIGTNVSDAAYADAVLSGQYGIYTSEVEPVPERDWNVIVISAPVFDPETKNITGALAAVMRVRDGDLFVPARPLETSSQTVSVTARVDGSEVLLHDGSSTFDDSIAANATVASTGWTVRVAHDRSPLTDQLRGLALAQGVGLLVILGLVGGLGFYEYVTNLRQTERLLDGFAHLQRGDYDYTLSLTSAQEWQQISDGYNELSRGLKQREREIRESEQRLEVLNRVLRHNLRNDMNVILTYAEMLPEFADGPKIQEASETIQRKGRGLISHGKKARQIEEAMESAEGGTEPIDAASTVERVVDEQREAFPGVTFETDVPTSAAAEAISSFELALENLVENAARHNETDDPWVRVAVTEADGQVVLTVGDDGPGIPEHEYEVLSEGQETALEHGSGVGLWLSYWVVDKSDGEIEFDDRDPTGAEVTITLDASDESVATDDTEGAGIVADILDEGGEDDAGHGESDPATESDGDRDLLAMGADDDEATETIADDGPSAEKSMNDDPEVDDEERGEPAGDGSTDGDDDPLGFLDDADEIPADEDD